MFYYLYLLLINKWNFHQGIFDIYKNYKKNKMSDSTRALIFTKGMGEMFTFKQRGVCLFVIYFTLVTLSLISLYSNGFILFSHFRHIESDTKITLVKTDKIRQNKLLFLFHKYQNKYFYFLWNLSYLRFLLDKNLACSI